MGDDSDGPDGVDIDMACSKMTRLSTGAGSMSSTRASRCPSDRGNGSTTASRCGRRTSTRSLAGRLARELPDPRDTDVGDGLGDTVGTDGELYDNEVGAARSGRLVDVEAAGKWDDVAYLNAVDVGRDGGAASAEEAAVHIVRDPDDV